MRKWPEQPRAATEVPRNSGHPRPAPRSPLQRPVDAARRARARHNGRSVERFSRLGLARPSHRVLALATTTPSAAHSGVDAGAVWTPDRKRRYKVAKTARVKPLFTRHFRSTFRRSRKNTGLVDALLRQLHETIASRAVTTAKPTYRRLSQRSARAPLTAEYAQSAKTTGMYPVAITKAFGPQVPTHIHPAPRRTRSTQLRMVDPDLAASNAVAKRYPRWPAVLRPACLCRRTSPRGDMTSADITRPNSAGGSCCNRPALGASPETLWSSSMRAPLRRR